MKAPQAPNPYQTAAVQQQMNLNAAATQQPYNMVGPYGTTTTTQTGTRTTAPILNKKGKVKVPGQEIPIYTQTTQLSPEQQRLYDQENALNIQKNELAQTQLAGLGDVLSQPLDLSNTAVEDYVTGLARKRLDPIWNQKKAEMETRLRNQGLQPGSEAYNQAMATFDYGMNDAYNQMLLQGRQQGINEMLTARQQPINEIIGLMTGEQLPQWQSLQMAPGANGVDLAQLINQNYQGQNAAYQAGMGGLYNLGSAVIGAGGSYLGRPQTTNVYGGGWVG